MITLKMLANACEVSVATVSKALNGAPDINADTAARIRKAAEEMGYVPSSAARYLKTNRSYGLGVIMDDGTHSGLTHEYFTHILDGFMRQAEELGYDVTLFSAQPGPWGPDYLSHAVYRHCDGVAVLVSDNSLAPIQALTASKIPVVTLDCHLENCSCIRSDNVQGESELVRYVYSQGHRKVASIFGEDTPVTRLRAASFYNTCSELGLEIPADYILYTRYHDPKASADAVRWLLELPDPPTCILMPDDFSLIGARDEIESMGLSIPNDLSIAGFDGNLMGMAMNPRLTTVRQDVGAIGKALASELVRCITEGSRFLPREIMIPCRLIPGGTVRRL